MGRMYAKNVSNQLNIGEIIKMETDPAKKNPVERAKFNPDFLNDVGKMQLAFEIIEEMSKQELDEFLLKYGYKR